MIRQRRTLSFGLCFSILWAIKAAALTGQYLEGDALLPQSCRIRFIAQPNGEPLGTCGATWVEDRKLLSADHCQLTEEDILKIETTRKIRVDTVKVMAFCPGSVPTEIIDRECVTSDHKFSTKLDLVLFTTQDALPIQPILIPNSKSKFHELLSASHCILSGYGRDNEEKYGTHHAIKAPFGYFQNGRPAPYDDMFNYDVIPVGGDVADFAGPKPGDSGSGLFCKDTSSNRWYLLGVHLKIEQAIIAGSRSLENLLGELSQLSNSASQIPQL